MDRRGFLKLGTTGLLGSMIPIKYGTCGEQSIQYFGWIPTKNPLKKIPLSKQTAKNFKGSGKGKTVLLYKYLEQVLGTPVTPSYQEGPDCIGHSAAMAVDILAATQISCGRRREKFMGKACSEAIYAGARYEIGYLVHNNSDVLSGNGAITDHCVEFLKDYGVLLRRKYGNIDLTEYSLSRTMDWGDNGVPDILEPIAKEHPVRSYALMESYEDCRDAIANGYPIIFGSKFGFNIGCTVHNPEGRDRQGFLHTCGEWAHSMCGLGVDDTKRPGILIINSAGSDWVQGPKRFNQPDGSFWVDATTIDGMCSGMRSSFAISNFVGFPKTISYNNIFK